LIFNILIYLCIPKKKDNTKNKINIGRSKNELLDEIKFEGKILMRRKIETNEQRQEAIRIYGNDNMLDILIDANYDHYFLDGTFKCVPRGIFYL
jgi:hypothetical protein